MEPSNIRPPGQNIMNGLTAGTILGAALMVAGLALGNDTLAAAGMIAMFVCVTAMLATPSIMLVRMLSDAEPHPAFRRVRQSALVGGFLLCAIGVAALFQMPIPLWSQILLIVLGFVAIGIWLRAGRRAKVAPAARGLAYAGAMAVAMFLSFVIVVSAPKWGC
jgi:Na+-transporting NADH:ubiquinone oxidoreductase subunit NqrB